MNSPLETFRIIVFKKCMYDFFTFTNTSLILVLILGVFLFFFYYNLQTVSIIPTRSQYILENIYSFILTLFRQQVNNLMALKYFPIVSTIFLFILMCNLFGLMPYSFTVTGHVIVTFCIAFSMFFGITLIGFVNNKVSFLNLFLPSGVPQVLLPFLVVIEIVSYMIRPFSLSIRLFANMLAGHTLLNIVSAFTFSVFKQYSSLFILPLLFLLFIVFLEFAIAFVQAYIFTILISIYINDVYNVSH